MKAIESSTLSVLPLQSRRGEARRNRRQTKPHPYQDRATETTLKLTVNVLLSIAAISALVHLLPHHRAGQEKLQEIQAEVQVTQGRVSKLQAEFSRSFDPQEAKSIMQEQSHRMDPTLLQIFWLERKSSDGQEFDTDAEFPESR